MGWPPVLWLTVKPAEYVLRNAIFEVGGFPGMLW